MDLRLSGQLAVVTGASKGIGAAIVRLLAEEGCDTVAVSRSSTQLRHAADQIASDTGHTVIPFPADLSRNEEVRRVAAAWQHADIFVNNAGAIPAGRLEDVDDAVWRTAWDLKVFGYINLTRSVLPAMGARGGGVIINVIGAAAQTRDPNYICGVTANAALTAFTMSVGSDSHRYGVRVVGINPGPVATDRLVALEQSPGGAAPRPFGRAANPAEIAAAVAFLASPVSGYTSGTILTLDGGISARAAP